MSIFDVEAASSKPLWGSSSRRSSGSGGSGLSPLSTNQLVQGEAVDNRLERNVGSAERLNEDYAEYMTPGAQAQAQEIEDSGGWMKYPMNALGAVGRTVEFMDRMGQSIRWSATQTVRGDRVDVEDMKMIRSGRDQEFMEKHGADLVGEDGAMSGSQQLTLAGWDKIESDIPGVAGLNSFGRFIAASALEGVQDPLSYLVSGGAGLGTKAILAATDASFLKAGVKATRALRQVVPDPKTGKVTRAMVDLADADKLESKMVDDILAEIDKIKALPDAPMKDATWDELVEAAAGTSRTLRSTALDDAGRVIDIPDEKVYDDVLHLGTKAKDDPISYGVLNKMRDELAEVTGRRNWHSDGATWQAYVDRVNKGRGELYTTGGLRFGVPFMDASAAIPVVTDVTRGAVSRVRSGVGRLKPFESIKASNSWNKIRENILPKLGAERYQLIAASRGWHGSHATYSQFMGARDSADLTKRIFGLASRHIDLEKTGAAARQALIRSLREGGMARKEAKKTTAEVMTAAYQALADGNKYIDWDGFGGVTGSVDEIVETVIDVPVKWNDYAPDGYAGGTGGVANLNEALDYYIDGLDLGGFKFSEIEDLLMEVASFKRHNPQSAAVSRVEKAVARLKTLKGGDAGYDEAMEEAIGSLKALKDEVAGVKRTTKTVSTPTPSGRAIPIDNATKEAVQEFVNRGNDAITKAGNAIIAVDPSYEKIIGDRNYFPISFTEDFSKSASDLLSYYWELNLDKLVIKTPVGRRKVDVWEKFAADLNRAAGSDDITVEDAMLLASVLPHFGNKTASLESLGIAAAFRRRTLGASGMFIMDEAKDGLGVSLRSSFPQNSNLSESLGKTLSALGDMRAKAQGTKAPKQLANLKSGKKTALQIDPAMAVNDYLTQVEETLMQQVMKGHMVRTGRAVYEPYKLDFDKIIRSASADETGMADALIEVLFKAQRYLDNESREAAQLMAKKPLIIAGRNFGEQPAAVLNDPVVVKALDRVEELIAETDKARVIDPHAGQRQIDRLVREGQPEHVAIQQVVATQLTGLADARAVLTDAYRSALVRRYGLSMEHVSMIPDEQSAELFDIMQQSMDFEAAGMEEMLADLTQRWATDVLGEQTAAKVDLLDPTTWVELDQYSESVSGKLLKSQGDWYDQRIAQIEEIFEGREPGHPSELDLKIELAGLNAVREELRLVAAGSPGKPMNVYQVISGGQGGVDQAALRGARGAGTPTGGTLPQGGRTNRGAQPELADEFDMTISSERSYIDRSMKNVDDADVTIAFLPGWGSKKKSNWRGSGGTQKTIEYASTGVWGEGFSKTDLARISHLGDGVYVIPAKGKKPVVIFTHQPKSKAAQQRQVARAQQWINTETQGSDIVINVAGPRDVKPLKAGLSDDALLDAFPDGQIKMNRQTKVAVDGKLLPSGRSRDVLDGRGNPIEDVLAVIDPESGDILLKNPNGMSLAQVQEQIRWVKARLSSVRNPDGDWDNAAPALGRKQMADIEAGVVEAPPMERVQRQADTTTLAYEEMRDVDVRDLMDVNQDVMVYKDFLLGKADDGKLRFTIQRFEKELKNLGVDVHGVQVRFKGDAAGKRDEYARLLTQAYYDTPGAEGFDGFTANGAVYQRRLRSEQRGIVNGFKPYDPADPMASARPAEGFVNLEPRSRVSQSKPLGTFGTPLERKQVITKKYREDIIELAENYVHNDAFIPRDKDGVPTGRWAEGTVKWLDEDGNLDLELVPIEIVYDELHHFLSVKGEANLMPGNLTQPIDVMPLEAAGPSAYKWEQELISLAKKAGVSATSIRADIRRVRAAQAAGESADEFLNDIAEKLQRKGVDITGVMDQMDRHDTWEDALEAVVPDGDVTAKVVELSGVTESVLDSWRIQSDEMLTEADVVLFLDEIDPKYAEAYREITVRKEAQADPFVKPDEPTVPGAPVRAEASKMEAHREWKDEKVVDVVEAVVVAEGGTPAELGVVIDAWMGRHTKSYDDPASMAETFKEQGAGSGVDDMPLRGYEDTPGGDKTRRFQATRRDQIKGDAPLERRNAEADSYMEFDEEAGHHVERSWSGTDTSELTPVQRRLSEEPLMGGQIPGGDASFAREVVYGDVYFAAGQDITIPSRLGQAEWQSPDFVSSKRWQSAEEMAETTIGTPGTREAPGVAESMATLEGGAVDQAAKREAVRVPDETVQLEGDEAMSAQLQYEIPEAEMRTGGSIEGQMLQDPNVPAKGERVTFDQDAWVEETIGNMLTQETTRDMRMQAHMSQAYTDREMAVFGETFALATSGEATQIVQRHRINTAQAKSAWELFRTTGDPSHLRDPDLLKTLALGEHMRDPNPEATAAKLVERAAAREEYANEIAGDLAEKTGRTIDEALEHIRKSSEGTTSKRVKPGTPFEVSTRGDTLGKQFSAFNARITGRGNRSIEEIYQMDVKGYPSVKAGKGKPPKDPTVDTAAAYDDLWREFADENPDLLMELYEETLAQGRPLRDRFAQEGRANQADSLTRLMEARFADLADDPMNFPSKIPQRPNVMPRDMIPDYTPEGIVTLEPGQIFVFGSNEAGIHGAGAAKQAMEWGATMGQGTGRQGDTYALPTMALPGQALPLAAVKRNLRELMQYAEANTQSEFLTTRVGTGLAGRSNEEISGLIRELAGEGMMVPPNVRLPRGWDPREPVATLEGVGEQLVRNQPESTNPMDFIGSEPLPPQTVQAAPQGAPPEVADLVGGPRPDVTGGGSMPEPEVGRIYEQILNRIDEDLPTSAARLEGKQKATREIYTKDLEENVAGAEWIRAYIRNQFGEGPPPEGGSAAYDKLMTQYYNNVAREMGYGEGKELLYPETAGWAANLRTRGAKAEAARGKKAAAIAEAARQKTARETAQAASDAEELVFTRVTTLNRGTKTPGDTYIGRGSAWGNPYIVKGKDSGKFKGRNHPTLKNADGTPVKYQVVDSNAEAVGRYMEDLWAWAESDAANAQRLIDEVHGGTLTYPGIPSPPAYSHGDVLADVADMLADGLGKPKNNKYLAQMFAVDEGVTPDWLNARVDAIIQQLDGVDRTYKTHDASRQATLREADVISAAAVKDMTDRLKTIQTDIAAATTKSSTGLTGTTAGGIASPAKIARLEAELHEMRPQLQAWVDQAYGPGRLVDIRRTKTGIDVDIRMPGDDFAGVQAQTDGDLVEFIRRTDLDPGDPDFLDDKAIRNSGMGQMVDQYKAIRATLEGRVQAGARSTIPERTVLTPGEAAVEQSVAQFEQLMDLVWKAIDSRDSTTLRNFVELKGKKGVRASRSWQDIMGNIDDPMQRALVQHWVESAWAADLPWDSDTLYHGWWQAQRQTVQAMDKGVDVSLDNLRHQMDAAAEVLGDAVANPRRPLNTIEAMMKDMGRWLQRGTGDVLIDERLRPSKVPPLRDLPGGVEDAYRPGRKMSALHEDVMRAGSRASGGEEMAAMEGYLGRLLDDSDFRSLLNEDDIEALRNGLAFFEEAAAQPSNRIVTSTGSGMAPASEFGLDAGEYSAMFVDKLIGRELEQSLNNMRALYTDTGFRWMNQHMSGVMQWWKAAATVSRPTFHIRNLMGGMWNNAILGVNPKTYFDLLPDIYRFRKLMKKKELSSYVDNVEAMDREVFAHLSDKNRAMFREAWHQDVLQAGFSRSGLESSMGGASANLFAGLLGGDKQFVGFKAGGQTMESFEDLLRIVSFNKYFDPEYPTITGQLAKEMTNTVHFDYANLTSWERKVKTFIPFYVWTRRNVPLQMRMLMEKPSHMLMYERARRNWNEQQMESDEPYAQYKKNSGWVMPWGRQSDDGGEWSQGVWSPSLPFHDLFEVPLFSGSTTNAGVVPLGDDAFSAAWFSYALGMVGPGFSTPVRGAEMADDLGNVQAPAGINEIIKIIATIPGLEASDIPLVSHQSYDGDMMVSKVGNQIFRTAVPFYGEYRALLGLRPNSPYTATDEGYLTEDMNGPIWDYRNAPNAIKNRLAKGFGFTYMSNEEAYWYAKEAERFLKNQELTVRQQLPTGP